MLTLGTVALVAGGALAVGAVSANAQNMGADRVDHQAEMQARFTENLNQVVADGKLTEAQKQAILTKHEEMKGQRENLRDLSPEERRETRESRHEEVEVWAQTQGIDLDDLHMGFGAGEGRNQGKGRGMGMHK